MVGAKGNEKEEKKIKDLEAAHTKLKAHNGDVQAAAAAAKDKLTNSQLKALLEHRGLNTTGNREALIKRQTAEGAWNKGRGQGGSSYATPMAIIVLATPHRYIPIYQR